MPPFRKLKHVAGSPSAYVERYLWPLPRFRREVVVMVDGVHSHGGLTDRLRNILSVYSYCKSRNISFRVYYVYPVRLEEILVPASYDWRIGRKEISYHVLDSAEISLYVSGVPEEDDRRHIAALDGMLGTGRRIQLREYGNAYFAKGQYRALFGELFRPSGYLKDRIDRLIAAMPEPYESVTLRFQALLGDFFEGPCKALGAEEGRELAQRCIEKIDGLRSQGYFSTEKVLVTSDSPTFIGLASTRPYIYTIPGRMEHMDFTDNHALDVGAKPFVDLFLLMRSERLTQLVTGRMYRSGFPAFAAELGGKAYNEILF